MDKLFTYRNKRIHYQDRGSGPVLVLLHGFLEDMSLWSFAIDELKNHFRLILLDLPGYGLSEPFQDSQNMDEMAELVNALMHQEGIKSMKIIGHSMGGYIALAFAAKYPDLLEGVCLFHSHPFEDGPTKRQERLRVVEALEAGKKDFIRQALPGFVAEANRARLAKEIGQMVVTAENSSLLAVKHSLRGMATRVDLSEMFIQLNCPKLVIIGDTDPSVPIDRLLAWCEEQKIAHSLIPNCGHMGYIEQPQASLEAIKSFLIPS